MQNFDDLKKLPHFEDDWLRGGPVRRWLPRGWKASRCTSSKPAARPASLRAGSQIDDFRIDYENFSQTLSDKTFPKGSDWLMLGPSGPRRLRLAIEHLAQHRGGIAFSVDLDPRWVIKCLKRGEMNEANLYKQHAIDQALTILRATRTSSASSLRPSCSKRWRRRSTCALRDHRDLLRWHGIDAAVPPLCARGTAPGID